MKKFALLAVAALLSACGGGGDGNQTAATNTSGPVGTPVPAPNGGDWTKTVTQTPEGGIMVGNPNAAVKLVEFSSMTCPHCAEFSEKGAPQLMEKYVKTGQVAFELRNFVRDPLDITMSLIARCAGATPQYFTLTDGMFADQKAIFERFQAVPQAQVQAAQALPPGQQFTRFAEFAGLQSWAAQRGLPSGRTSQCLSNQGEIEKLVQMNSDAASTYNIPGTPAFLINGKLAENAAAWETLEPQIREALGG